MKASMCSFLLALPGILLNDLQILLYKAFIFLQTDIYANSSMQIFPCGQDKTMVSDDFKRNLCHFNMKKVGHVQFFHIKMKVD